jgi:1,2-diacylglycerol 3-beta-glucosyltransferase
MGTRALSAAILLASGLVAWLAVTSVLAARLLQTVIGLSLLYVGYLAFRGWQLFGDALRSAQDADGPPPSEGPAPPFISVVVAARDEAPVIGGIVHDLVAQRYPERGVGRGTDGGRRRFEVLIVDHGSRDGTGELARAAAEAAGAPAGLLRVLERGEDQDPQTKGAALAAAMPETRGELIAVLDADSRIGPSFLADVERAWRRDPGTAALQVRRRLLNADANWLTAAQADELLMDLASQCGRRRTDGTAELRGNGMVVRREALERVGGWNPVTITEDLDLSTRLALAGEHIAVAPEVIVDDEAVENLPTLWRQRMRWAEGSIRRLMELGPGFLGGPEPVGRKLDFLIFTTEFIIPPLFAASVVASLLTIPLPVRMDWTVPVSLLVGYGLGTFLLAYAGLLASGVRGRMAWFRATRGALFLSHWLVVIPAVLLRIAAVPRTAAFVKTPRIGHRQPS